MPETPADEFFEACPDLKEQMLSMREAFGPFAIVELHLDRQDGDGMVQIHPDPNVIR